MAAPAPLFTKSRVFFRVGHTFAPRIMLGLSGLVITLLLACAPPDDSGGTGSVGLLMTDAPSDDFEAINMTFTRIELIGGRMGRATVFEGLETFDLMALRDASELFSVTGDVPTGRYDKIRFTFADRGIELVRRDGDREHPELPDGHRIDFRPETALEVNDGTLLLVEIDIDVDKSIHRDISGRDPYSFRPVIHTRIVKNVLNGRLARLHGTVVSLDTESQSFKLCHMRRPHAFLSGDEGHGRPTDRAPEDVSLPEAEERHHPRRHCIDIDLADDASIFDANGAPLDSLSDTVQGQRALLAGRIRPRDEGMDLIALLMLIGPPDHFHHVRGFVSTDYDELDQQFDLELRGDRPDLVVSVSGGTKLFERGGGEVGTDAIMAGLPAGITGIFDEGDPERPAFRALVIGLDLEEPDLAPLHGEIVAIRPEIDPEQGECHLELASDDGDTVGLGVGAQTRTFLVDAGGMVSSVVRLEDLVVGDRADIYGPPNRDGRLCRPTGSIIAFPGDESAHEVPDANEELP